MKTSMLTLSATVLALGFSSAAFAQSYTINGQPVPEDQVTRIQEYCSTLSAPAAGEGGGIGAGASASTIDTETSTQEGEEGTTGPAGTDMDWANMDMTTIDSAACEEGGFSVSGTAGAAATTSTGSGAAATNSMATDGGIGAGAANSTIDTENSSNPNSNENAPAPSGSGTSSSQ